MNRLYNKNKKGTIILSHYRSGGTQLKEVISNVLEADNLGEIDFDLNNTNFEDEFYSKLSLESYGVILDYLNLMKIGRKKIWNNFIKTL